MAKNNMDQDILKVLFSEQEIHDRIQEMGDQLYDKFTTGIRCLWGF